MQPVLLDSSIYISAFRGGDTILARGRLGAETTPWLSAVVLQELYAGARDRDRAVVERLERDFDQARRILVPDLGDWIQAGKVLARLAAKYGYGKIGRSRLTNDALIAMSAARAGIRVLTANARDFSKLAEFRAFSWQIVPL
jgi:predicted nucleic acid-binding protein